MREQSANTAEEIQTGETVWQIAKSPLPPPPTTFPQWLYKRRVSALVAGLTVIMYVYPCISLPMT